MLSSHFYLPKLPCFYRCCFLKLICITFNIAFHVLKKKYSLSYTRQGIKFSKRGVFNGVFVILHLLLVSTSCSSPIVSSSLRSVTSSAPLRSWLNATHTNITVHHTAPAKNTDTKISVWQKHKTNTLLPSCIDAMSTITIIQSLRKSQQQFLSSSFVYELGLLGRNWLWWWWWSLLWLGCHLKKKQMVKTVTNIYREMGS